MLDLTHLPDQLPDERVVLFLRPTSLILLGVVLMMALLYAAPVLGILAFWDVVSAWLAHPTAGPAFIVITLCYVATVWLFAFVHFTNYYLDTWIVTTERIINVDQDGLFSRVTSELHLATVQDVTSEVKGVLPTLFGFGTIAVQTAAEKERFEFTNVPHPEKVKEAIVQLVEEDKKRHYAAVPQTKRE